MGHSTDRVRTMTDHDTVVDSGLTVTIVLVLGKIGKRNIIEIHRIFAILHAIRRSWYCIYRASLEPSVELVRQQNPEGGADFRSIPACESSPTGFS